MSNIIPPLLSNTPPPTPSPDEDDDDEFGDFTGANYLSYGCDNLSLPSSPLHSPKNVSIPNGLDINSNDEKSKVAQIDLGTKKDFQDKRKLEECFNDFSTTIKDNFEHPGVNHLHIKEVTPGNRSKAGNKSLTSCSLIVDEKINDQLGEEDLPHDELKCDSHNDIEIKLNQNNTPVEEVISTKHLEVNENTETTPEKANLEDFNDLAVNENKVMLDVYPNREIDVTAKHLENVDLESFSKSDESNRNFTKVENVENIETAPYVSKLESNECGVKDISEFYPPNQVSDSSCKENNGLSIQVEENKLNHEEDKVEVGDLKTGSRKGSFNDLTQEIIDKTEENVTLDNHKEEQSCNVDDFGDFAFSDEIVNAAANRDQRNDEFGAFNLTDSNKDADDERQEEIETIEDEFGNFSFPETNIYPSLKEHSSLPTKEETRKLDDFDDFGEFTSTTVNLQAEPSLKQDDEFGNFANFDDIVEEPVILTLNEKQAFEKAGCILTEIFPVPSDAEEDFHYISVEKDDFIFNELKEITETRALTYQWSKSTSQNMLLKALNIDARNILYGPSWNPSIPRFAANLGLTPLEPIKTEILTPSVLKSSPSVSTQPPSIEIPTAQFDWDGSGLINPLDSVSKTTSTASPQTDVVEKFNELPADEVFTLKPTLVSLKAEDTTKAPSKSDLEQKIDPPDQQFEDFISYQSTPGPPPHTSWPSLVPLRETYISNDNITSNLNSKELPLDIESWLQPTIVTPELPRKDLVIGEEELPNIQTPELIRKNMPVGEVEDDFDDFQMGLPETKDGNSETGTRTDDFDILQPIKSEPILLQPAVKNFDFSDLSPFEVGPQRKKSKEPTKNDLEIDVIENKGNAFEDEDEFTDFHFSAPIPQPPTPIMEPLKPVPVHPKMPATPSTQINWPDPGITEEEIKKFEMVFSRPKEFKMEEPKKEPKKLGDKTKTLSSANSIEDDEWSDFVSVQKPSPVHKFQLNERERTSSPDLTLSVLNLGNIQPTKQPIPVITPQGLVQTKLSANATTMSPKTQLKNKLVFQQPQSQPSIISNQYASQAYTFNSGYYSQNTKTALNFPLSQQQKSLDEDEWSDFVSSPIPQTMANGYQENWQGSSSHQQLGWTTAGSPNIITNPGHFVQSGSDVKSKKVSKFSVNSKKSTVPSISLPELEFVAPKGRTSTSRKK